MDLAPITKLLRGDLSLDAWIGAHADPSSATAAALAFAALGAVLGVLLLVGYLTALALDGFPNACSERPILLPFGCLPLACLVSWRLYLGVVAAFYAGMVLVRLLRETRVGLALDAWIERHRAPDRPLPPWLVPFCGI